jgi:predicted ABC-type ATPase
LRLAIANFLMPSSKPTIYVIAGSNGAGKTTFAREFLPSIGVIRFLNADEIARGLSSLKPEAVVEAEDDLQTELEFYERAGWKA